MQQKNLLLAFVLSGLIMIGWIALSRYLAPPQQPKQSNAEVAKTEEKNKPKDEEGKELAAKDKAKEKKLAEKKADEKERIAKADLQRLPPTDVRSLVRLGAKQRDSRFHLYVELDPRGAGVRTVWLNKYQAADRYGKPVWIGDDEKKEPMPLGLVPAGDNVASPSFLLFAFDVTDPNDNQPLDTLGRVQWTVTGPTSEEIEGRRSESVSFQAETQGVIITKTYSLTEGEYHLGLEVKMRRKEGADKNIAFRYQLTGAHGLPVEGKWYTSTFRNALIAVADKKNGYVTRDLQDLRQISNWGGGNPVLRDPGHDLLYAGVNNQFFASAIVVDNQQKNRSFLHQARPTLETALTKGTVDSIAEDGSSFVLKPLGNEPQRTFSMRPNEFANFSKGKRIAVLHHTASAPERNGEYPEIVENIFIREEDAPPAVWLDDITVRVSTEPVELKGHDEVVHKYLLYNGPVKVSQLFPPPGLPSKPFEQGGVQTELYSRYHDELQLNTLTDYHTPGAMGSFANAIYWTQAIIFFTNIMHAVLGYIHVVIPSYALCIILLTVLVRGMMFPLSRKQALMSVRMQQLAPELKKLQEKYKDDRQGMGVAQMELYRKHGVNPFGSCWVLLLQMPIIMGLYFALQESTHFRLAEFWPTWIPNLAAPDMLFSWTEHIPWISRVEDYGSILYLGPYFNLLPVIAVALMIAQQKLITPPPADEQQAMQQKMMKYMMIFFGLMFYKFAAGLCLYFIASSVWGFCERKLLPQKKTEAGEPATPPGESYFQKLLRRTQGENVTTAPATGITTRNGGFTGSPETRGRTGGKRRRDKRRQGPRGAETTVEDNTVLGRWRKRIHEWWVAVLKEAEKKHRN